MKYRIVKRMFRDKLWYYTEVKGVFKWRILDYWPTIEWARECAKWHSKCLKTNPKIKPEIIEEFEL